MGSPKRMVMPTKPKLRSVKPTAKDEIAALKDKLEAAEQDAASWKKEATEAEAIQAEALKLLGLSAYSELVAGVRELRCTLGMADDDKRSVNTAISEKMSDAERAESHQADALAAEARATALDVALSEALEDRKALLKHAGLTPRKWWELGGAHEVHIDCRFEEV